MPYYRSEHKRTRLMWVPALAGMGGPKPAHTNNEARWIWLRFAYGFAFRLRSCPGDDIFPCPAKTFHMELYFNNLFSKKGILILQHGQLFRFNSAVFFQIFDLFADKIHFAQSVFQPVQSFQQSRKAAVSFILKRCCRRGSEALFALLQTRCHQFHVHLKLMLQVFQIGSQLNSFRFFKIDLRNAGVYFLDLQLQIGNYRSVNLLR